MSYLSFMDDVAEGDILICNFDGTAGDQSFLDESPNNWTLTGNVNHELSTAQSLLGTTSLRVNRLTAQGVLTSAAAAAALGVNEPFTAELFVYVVTTLNFSNAGTLVEWFHGTTERDRINLYSTAPSRVAYENEQFGSEEATPPSIPTNQWVHIAMTYDGTNIKRWKAGALDFTIARTFGSFSTGQLLIGGPFSGATGASDGTLYYIGPTRISRGCRYTSAFTPPTGRFVPGT